MARQTIDIQNTSGSALAIDNIAIENNLLAIGQTVRLTDFASVPEVYDDEQIHAHIDAGNAVLIVNGTTLNQTESQAALQPASSQTIVEEGPATAPVDSVNGETGPVVLDANDVGADPAGTASTEVSNHEAAANPHPLYILSALIGAANGVASLDGTGKIPLAQIPDMNGLAFQGLWNANTNTPTLPPGGVLEGWFWIVDTAGTQDFGSGPISFEPKDWAIYADGEIRKIDNTDSVVSVNGNTGVVVLTLADLTGVITAGQHGTQTDPTLHAVASASANGFMSSADFTKLLSIEANAKDDQNASEVPVTDSLPEITGDVQQSLENLQTALGAVVLGEIPTAVARRTINQSVTGTFTDVSFNETSVETDTSVVEHDNVNTDRLNLKEIGSYLVFFSTMISCGGEPNVNFRVRLNDTTTVADFPDGFFVDAGSATDFDWNLTRIGIVTTTNVSDFISLQVSETGGTNDIINTLFGAIRLRAPKGDTGPAGTGAVNVEDDGDTVPGGPFGILNFVGATATQNGSKVDITFPTATVYRKAWGYTSSTINFTTTPVTAPIANFSAPDGQFTESGGEFTSTFTGTAEVSASFNASGSNRCRVEGWIEVNGTEVSGTRTRAYTRNNITWGSGSIEGVSVDLVPGDVVRLRVVRAAGGVTLTLQTNTRLHAKRIT